ncbi:MAG: hypothetical protein QM679_12205 [Patulibacter sp.]
MHTDAPLDHATHDEVARALTARGAIVLGRRDRTGQEAVIDDVACDIAALEGNARALLRALRRSATTKQSVSFDLGKQPRAGRDGSLALATLLHSLGVIYGPAPHPKATRVQFEVPAHLRELICGGWLERAAYRAVCRACGDVATRGIRVRHETFGDAELDVAAVCEDELLIVECRSGEFQSKTERLRQIVDALNANAPTRALMVSVTMDPAAAARLEALHGFGFVVPAALPAALAELTAGRREDRRDRGVPVSVDASDDAIGGSEGGRTTPSTAASEPAETQQADDGGPLDALAGSLLQLRSLLPLSLSDAAALIADDALEQQAITGALAVLTDAELLVGDQDGEMVSAVAEHGDWEAAAARVLAAAVETRTGGPDAEAWQSQLAAYAR